MKSQATLAGITASVNETQFREDLINPYDHYAACYGVEK